MITAKTEQSVAMYTAWLHQINGTAGLTPTVIHNTIGEEIIWTRDTNGLYYGTTLENRFIENKTLILPWGNNNSYGVCLPLGEPAGMTGYMRASYYDEKNILIETFLNDSNYIDLHSLINTYKIAIEIKIYNYLIPTT